MEEFNGRTVNDKNITLRTEQRNNVEVFKNKTLDLKNALKNSMDVFTSSGVEHYYSEVKQDGLTILKYSDHAEISGCDMSATSVEIPASVDGVPVTVIQMYAFQPTEITEITIPDSVKEIGNYAFSGNKELKSVTISDSIEKIGLRAFEQCPKLETVELPDKVFDMGAKAFSETPWLEAHRDSNSLVIVSGMLLDAEGAEGDIVIPLRRQVHFSERIPEKPSAHIRRYSFGRDKAQRQRFRALRSSEVRRTQGRRVYRLHGFLRYPAAHRAQALGKTQKHRQYGVHGYDLRFNYNILRQQGDMG